MKTKLRFSEIILVHLLSITLFQCSRSDDPGMEDAPRLVQIEIESSDGNRLDISGTSTTTLSISGLDQTGEAYNIVGTVIWSSDNSNVTVSQNGIVEAQVVGESQVQVESEGVTATYPISIWDSSAPRTEIFVSDVENLENPPWRIMRYFADGSYSEVFTDEQISWPQDIVILEEDEVALVSNFSTGRITKYNVNTGEYLGNFATGISGPTRMEIGVDNLLYVLQWNGTGIVKRYNLNGTFVDNFTTVGVPQSIGMDWDSEGNLYVSSFQDANIRKFDSEGNDLGLFASTNLVGPTDIWFDSEGNLLVNDWNTGRVVRFSTEGSFLNNLINGLVQPEGTDFLANGNFLIGNGGPGEIKEYDPSGSFLRNIVPTGTNGLKQPNAVTVRNVN